MVDEYYSLKQYVSNSDLTALQIALGERPDFPGKQQAYDFGNLFDAIMTENEKIVTEYHAVVNSDGELVEFDEDTFRVAMNMKRDAMAHPSMALLMRNLRFQVVHKKTEFAIQHGPAAFKIPVRIKMDGENKQLSTGWDLKSTKAKTQKAFYESLFHFDYDRQCAWYMDIAGLDRFWFTGVGKDPLRTGRHPVFFHAVQRGDDFYKSGRAKYERLAHIYDFAILNLDIDLIYHLN